VTDVVNQGYRTPPGAGEQPVVPADELVAAEALRTGAESTIEVKFIDGSELSVEASSEVVLSDYVFDAEAAASTGIINLNAGLFRFSSNDMPDSGLQLKTPVATIGIRGTEFLVTVTSTATIVDILDGAVHVAPAGDGEAITCEGGQSILVAGPDEDAVCGDFGSFATAAGGAPTTQTAGLNPSGEARGGTAPRGGESGSSGGGSPGGGNSGGGDPGGGDPGGGDPGGGDPGGGDPGGGDPGGGDPGGGDPGGGDPGGVDPGGNPGAGQGNHSGLGDGTNPGQGHGNGNANGNGNGNGGGGNGGANNPGGGKK
jgi:hypothetical protein